MNKKINTIFFVLIATVVNILITIIVFAALIVLFNVFIAPHVSPEIRTWTSMLIFIMAISLSFLIYQLIMKAFTKKVDMEKYFYPFFAPKNRKINRD